MGLAQLDKKITTTRIIQSAKRQRRVKKKRKSPMRCTTGLSLINFSESRLNMYKLLRLYGVILEPGSSLTAYHRYLGLYFYYEY